MGRSHFLDAMIIVARVAPWDRSRLIVKRYFTLPVTHCTSLRVFRECRNVLNRLRRLSVGFLNFLGEKLGDFQGYQPSPFLRKMVHNYAKENYLSEREKSTLWNFLEANEQPLNQMVLMGVMDEGFLETITSAMAVAQTRLQTTCNPSKEASIFRHDEVPKNIQRYYESVARKLDIIVGYRPDIEVLLDACYVSAELLDEPLYFVTFDRKHILNNARAIEAILPSITLMEPR